MDISKNKSKYSDDFTKRIDKVLESNQPLAENAQVSFVNSFVNTFPLQKDWHQRFHSLTFEGGFYLERAIKTALLNGYRNKDSYPVIVVVTDSIENAVADKDFSDFKFAFPESNLFFNLNDKGILQEHSLAENPLEPLSATLRACRFCDTVLEYKLSDNSIAYLPHNSNPAIILKKDIFNTTAAEIKEKNWQSALAMQAKWTAQILHPETSDKEWLGLVKSSFISKVMTPVTSYLVVENEAQKAILKRKQAQVLSGNKSLDLDEDSQRMSEPGLWVLAILFCLIIWHRQKRKRQWIE